MKKFWIYTVVLLVPFLVGCTLPAPTRSGAATATQISETQPSITLAPLSSLPTDTPEPENTATLASTGTPAFSRAQLKHPKNACTVCDRVLQIGREDRSDHR